MLSNISVFVYFFAYRSWYSVGEDQVIIALALNDHHVIYYHMDTQCPIELEWTYFASPDYLVVSWWLHCAFFCPDTCNPTKPNIYHYTKFLEGVVGYTLSHVPCIQLMALINYSNAVLPFVVTVFAAL